MDDVERVGAITYEDFFRDYLEANQLCVFSTEVTQHWRSRKEWVMNGRPHLEILSNQFGHSIAPVANCGQAKYNSQVKQDMSVAEFCDYWMDSCQSETNKTETLYLKDWHFWHFLITRRMKRQFILNLTGLMSSGISVWMSQMITVLSTWAQKEAGPLSMQMFSGHTVGLQTFVAARNGFFIPLVRRNI